MNLKKYVFGASEIRFWGMIVSADGIRPDPAKVEALEHITRPKNKEELNSFICMMQSNSEFIAEFSKKAAKLRELLTKSAKFRWEKEHQTCYEELLLAFKKETLLRYFDPSLQTFVIVDAHQKGLGAVLSQGNSIQEARPVAVASRTTSKAEKQYPQLDLEAIGIDFGLRRFRDYLVGSPMIIKVITDHKPLVPIFNRRSKGSIRTQRIKLKHQDIPYTVEYRKGKLNQSDYLTRHAKPLETLCREEKEEPNELNNLLYTLHTTPVTDHIGISTIASETSADEVLKKIVSYVRGGTWIPKEECEAVEKLMV